MQALFSLSKSRNADLKFFGYSAEFGRRTVYLLSLLVACLAYVWLCFATSAGEFVGAHALLGLAGAPFEALPAISIADIFFAHERGTMTGFYIIGLSLGSFLGPICSGYIFSAQGFRWIYRWGAILLAIMFVIMYFTAEETRFERPVGEEASASTEEALSNREISAMQGLDEKEAHSSHVDMLHEDDTLLSHDSFQLQWKPFRVFSGSIKQYCLQCFQPLLCAWYPAIFWTGISYGSCVAWLAVLGSSSAAIFAAPPYLFSPDDLGLIWIAPLIGSLLGAVYAGPFNDKVTLWLAKRNRGWREPEFRLWAFLPGALILSGGLILYGAGAAAGLPWIGPVFGMGMVGFGLSIGGTVGISFVIDTYKDIHGEAVTTVILIRNIIGFGVTFGIQQWIEGMGLRNCFILIGCLAFVITNFAGVFIKFGKPFRRSTQSAYKTLTRTKAS